MKKNNNIKIEEKSEPLDKKDFDSYIKECRKQAFKKLHRTHMSFFAEEVKGSISKIEKIIKKRSTSEVKDSILSSPFAQKAKFIKKSKAKRLGTQQALKTKMSLKPEVQQEVNNLKPQQSQQSIKSMSSYRDDNTAHEFNANMNNNNEEEKNGKNAKKKKLTFYEKNIEFEKKKEFELSTLRNKKLVSDTAELKEKPFVSEKSKKLLSNQVKKPVYMRVWEDEELKEQKLFDLKSRIEAEKKYYSEVNINPISLKKNNQTSKYNTVEREQKFENWFESNKLWHKKKQIQKQVLYEMKQNEFERSLADSNRGKPKLNDSLPSNRSFLERLNDDNAERKNNLIRLKAELNPSFHAKTNNKSPSYFKRNLSANTSYHTVNVIKKESNLKNIKVNYRSTNSNVSTKSKIKPLIKSKSSNSFFTNKNKKEGGKWEGMIDKVNSHNSSFNYRSSNEEKLYKINVENSCAWDKSKGSKVVFDYKYSPLLLSLAQKKFVNMDDIVPKRPVASTKAKRLSLGFTAPSKREGGKSGGLVIPSLNAIINH